MSWGPFVPDLAADERKARLRSLQLAVRILTGVRGREAEAALRAAEIGSGDAKALADAERALDQIPALDRRRILSSFATTLPSSRRSSGDQS